MQQCQVASYPAYLIRMQSRKHVFASR